jgi:NADPH:quinone reductase
MLTIEVSRFGGSEVLVPRQSPDPVPGRGEVVIDVAVVDTLFLDVQLRGARGHRRPHGPWQNAAADVKTFHVLFRRARG